MQILRLEVNPEPIQKRKLTYSLSLCIAKPAGCLCCSTDAEFGAINSSLEHILTNKNMFKDKQNLIATDCQSILKAFKIGPLRRYKYLGIGTSPLWIKSIEFWNFEKN